MEAIEWGDRITISDVAEMTERHPLFQKHLAEARDRAIHAILSGESFPRIKDSWRNRIGLAWRCLRGRITWDDIN